MAKRMQKAQTDGFPSYRLTICGFKSIAREISIEIRPLTILAGANSSGKSSLLQPLLMMKQTMETPIDKGALLLDGSHVKFTSTEQFLSRIPETQCPNELVVEFAEIGKWSHKTIFVKTRKGIDLREMIIEQGKETIPMKKGMSHKAILKSASQAYRNAFDLIRQQYQWHITGIVNQKDYDYGKNLILKVVRDRCFLRYQVIDKTRPQSQIDSLMQDYRMRNILSQIIHLPGLRGNPERNYKTTAINPELPEFPGTFENYVASIISLWQKQGSNKMKKLSANLQELGLTSTVGIERINETQIEIKVGRLPSGYRYSENDFVNIADVGVGVSQVLPVLVALLVAGQGSFVYIEQPEIHLHPRAQVILSEMIADAAKRGVNVIIETHSSLLLLGIQTLIAEGELSPDLVKLHWFIRNENGSTMVDSKNIDNKGAYGDWSEDFGDVELKLESRYLDAAEK